MRETVGDDEPVLVEFSREELEDLIGHLRTGQHLRPGHPRQQRLMAKLRGFGAAQSETEASTICPLERDTPHDVSWLADWVHGRLHELTDADEHAVVWKQAHLIRFLLGRLHDWLEENDFPTAAVTTFQAEALVSHVARYLEHLSVCQESEETVLEKGHRAR